MQQSSATPSLHLGFLGLRKIVACSQPYLAVASCIYSFWHGVIPTSYFIFNDFYTCICDFVSYMLPASCHVLSLVGINVPFQWVHFRMKQAGCVFL